MLLKLINGGIENIEHDNSHISGCPTCDYGGKYITNLNIELTTFNIYIEVIDKYEYQLSIGQIMKILLPNLDLIQSFNEIQFSEWLKNELNKEVGNIEYEEVEK